MIELNNNRRRDVETREVAERDAEVRKVFKGQTRFVLGQRSDIAAGNGLWPGDQQYVVIDSEADNEFFIFDRRRSVAKSNLGADVQRHLDARK